MATPQFGIFGPTPEQIRMAEQARREQTFAQQAQGMGAFGPLYQISRGLTSQGINMLGQSLFPQAQSPQLQQATALQQLKQQYAGVDLTNPNNMMKLAQDLSSVGATEQAIGVAQQARNIQAEQQRLEAEVNLKRAQAARAVQEKTPKLAERLVELETKKSLEGLNPQETAELVALQKVVKLQSPKGVDLSGLGSVFGQEAAKAEAKAAGADIATIQGKQQSVESLKSARNILEQGIYSGSYGEFQAELAKKSLGVVGDLKRVENTEVFINEVSSNVIPLLQEFGGNDSNEELRFLQRLVGGDITLQESSIRRILDNAIKKIERGIQRTAAKGQAVREGKMPDLPKAQPKPAQTRTTKSGVTYEIIED